MSWPLPPAASRGRRPRPCAAAASSPRRSRNRLCACRVLRPRGRMHDLDLRPVGFELFGQDHRERGAGALADLRPSGHKGDLAAGVDREPLLGTNGSPRAPSAACFPEITGTRRASAAPERALHLEKVAARCAHDLPPIAAARCTARRSSGNCRSGRRGRRKRVTSASEGRGFSTSRAAASRIIPGWQ